MAADHTNTICIIGGGTIFDWGNDTLLIPFSLERLSPSVFGGSRMATFGNRINIGGNAIFEVKL
jgi:hypothetical protein